jgi:hypothetical protein
MSRKKPTARETELQETINRLQLTTCAATWMLRNGQAFKPSTWYCVVGPKYAKLLVHTNEDGFPSQTWHDSEVTTVLRHHLLAMLSDGGQDEEFEECSAAIEAVMYGGTR